MTDQDLKAVLIGCGSMSRVWLESAMKIPGLCVVGLVDLNPAAAREKAEKFGLPPAVVYTTLAQAIAANRPDMVFDVTVPSVHKQVTLESLASGCHVLGEKPMAESLDDARQMVVAANKAGKLYAVIQNRRYEPNIQRLRRLLDAGRLGQVEEIHSDFFMGAHFGGFRDQMDFPLLIDMAIHTFDAARYIGKADPVSVYCHSFNPRRSWYKGQASAVAVFEMTGPIVYTYRGSWCAEGLPTTWEAQWRIIAQRGTATWDGGADIKAQIVAEGSPQQGLKRQLADLSVDPLTLDHHRHDAIIREFVDCVRTGGKPQTICDDNIKSLAMVLAAVESARSGRRVTI